MIPYMNLQSFLFTLALGLNISLFLQGCGDSDDSETCKGFKETADLQSADADALRSARQKRTKKQRAHPEIMHELLFAVKLKSHSDLEHMLLDRSNLSSPNYGKWLSSREASALIVDAEALHEVHVALKEVGAEVVKTTRGGELVRAKASVHVWEHFLQCKFYVFESNSKRARIAADTYTIPLNLSNHLEGILRLKELPNFNHTRVTFYPKSKNRANSLQEVDTTASITPEVLRARYNIPDPAASKGTAATMRGNTTQAVFASLGQHWSPSDREAFQRIFHLPNRSVTELDSHDMANDTWCEKFPSDCDEANLDVQWMLAVSPLSEMGFYYENEHRTFADFLEDILEMSNPPEVISISYGEPEVALLDHDTLRTVFNIAAMKLGVQGVTIIVASGDDGAQSSLARTLTCDQIQDVGLQVNWPASSPYVTAVGATMGVESGLQAEEKTCQIQCTKKGEECIALGTGPMITSGGGYSKYPKPEYQNGHVQCEGRGVPDVALAGHAYEIVVGARLALVDGTSASDPAFGGMVSLVNAKRLAAGLPPVGFINPAIYQHASSFNDITFGNNKCGTFDQDGVARCCGGFEAGPGWDATTGLGSVDFRKFETIFAGALQKSNEFLTSGAIVI